MFLGSHKSKEEALSVTADPKALVDATHINTACFPLRRPDVLESSMHALSCFRKQNTVSLPENGQLHLLFLPFELAF